MMKAFIWIATMWALGGACLSAADWQAPDAASILCPVLKGEKKGGEKKAAALAKRMQTLHKGINAPDANGQTLLMMAAAQDHRLLVCYLIALGADTTPTDKNGKTALDYAQSASLRELLSVCKPSSEILSHENKQRIAREQGLEDAAIRMSRIQELSKHAGKLKEIAHVLMLGVKLDDEAAPTFHEQEGMQPECLALLIRRGYYIDKPGADGKVKLPPDALTAKLALALEQKVDTADEAVFFRAALLANDTKAVKTLLKKNAALIHEPLGKGVTPLALVQSAEMVKILTAAGADAKEESDTVSFIITNGTASSQESEVVQALAEAGAAVPKQALVQLCMSGSANAKTAQALIKAGASVSETDGESGNTALHYAAARGKLNMVKLLLEEKADPNAINAEGDTPLLYFLKQSAKQNPAGTDMPELTKALLKGGANPKAKTADGQNALQLAKSLGRDDLGKIIKSAASK